MRYKFIFLKILLICFLFQNVHLYAEELPPPAPVGGEDTLGRDFALMAIYGTMSGIIIGAASLAFTSRPLTKLRRVAIGASLGLYVGILLGGLVALDRSLPAGGSIFDMPPEEEVPIVKYDQKDFEFSFPTILAGIDGGKKNSDKDSLWLGASILKMTF